MAMNPSFRYKPLWLLLGYANVGLIIYLSVTPAPPMPDIGFDWQDKLYHLLAYFIVMFWFVQIYHHRVQRLVLAVTFIAMGVGLEWLQSFEPQRYAEWQDMVANSTGVLLALLLAQTGMAFWLQRFEQRFLMPD